MRWFLGLGPFAFGLWSLDFGIPEMRLRREWKPHQKATKQTQPNPQQSEPGSVHHWYPEYPHKSGLINLTCQAVWLHLNGHDGLNRMKLKCYMARAVGAKCPERRLLLCLLHSWRGKLILLRSRRHFISLACSSPIVLELILKAVNLHLTSFSIFAENCTFPPNIFAFYFFTAIVFGPWASLEHLYFLAGTFCCDFSVDLPAICIGVGGFFGVGKSLLDFDVFDIVFVFRFFRRTRSVRAIQWDVFIGIGTANSHHPFPLPLPRSKSVFGIFGEQQCRIRLLMSARMTLSCHGPFLNGPSPPSNTSTYQPKIHSPQNHSH